MHDDLFLKINNMSVIYETGEGIFDINLDIGRGEFIALVGSNGAGKSTLINSISGLQDITSGSIEFNDKYLDSRHPYKSLGFSPQRQVIDWYLNVFDNVVMGASLAGYNKKESKQLTEEALSIVDLNFKRDKMVDELSGGQQQRVQIARALVHKPDFIILDEPTSGLDVESSEKLLSYLKKQTKIDNNTVIVSSHDLNLLENYCEKMIYISDGRVLYYGDINEFIQQNDTGRLIIIYKGSLPPEKIERLSENGLKIFEDQPLEVSLNKNQSISKVIELLEEDVDIIEIKRKDATLRDIYLKIINQKGE